MDKLLYFIVLMMIIYMIFEKMDKSSSLMNEGFENITLGSADDQNAINKLAQISSQLMAGGVTVPGNMNLQGELNWTGNLPRLGPAENKFTFHTPPDARKGLWIAPSSDDANSNWAWHHALNLNRSGSHNLGGNLSISGELRGNMANDQENGLKLPYNVWIKSRSPDGQDPYKILFYQDGRTYHRSGNGYEFRRANDQALLNINDDGAIRTRGRGMRIFTMTIGADNPFVPIQDPQGNRYNRTEWICFIGGIRLDSFGGMGGAFNEFCVPINNVWHYRADLEGERESNHWPTIVAIPVQFFDLAWDNPHGPGFMGGW
jgi:hypothetical protein